MKCAECKGRGHFLMPMSTPTCEVCDGTGAVADGHETGRTAVGLDVGAPEAGVVLRKGAKCEWIPFRGRASGPMGLLGGPAAELRLQQLARDEERLRETAARYEASARGVGGAYSASRWDDDRAELRVVVFYNDVNGGADIRVPAEYIKTHYRTIYERDPHRMGHRLAAIEVKEGDDWRVLRTFGEHGDTEGS